ncbi:hypothetical protein DLE60_23845 [Micromonospora globispora]|uniref:Cell wall anchor protein n=1 Tax=Micromonospora globispora TaxID=1450148 RepID=A0A317K502_9ACTN|nr:hypothetical protein [Micromonospora globispora]PWU47002.1 hypothetical protein DLJ46_16090 [Micromonospora globispora]PWU57769.1 hypothetical protein DLE60_23845 [Micromonospora globispora]RQW91103.1 hypothetical protein DKL51_21580 [Micromonospora globispora]
MIFRNRPLVRFGAAALLASGAFTALGAPAQAAGTETDLSLDVVGTRVADGVEGKLAFVKVTNKGENTPSELAVRADVSKVDWTKVAPVPAVDGCELEGTQQKPTAWTCFATTDGLPGAGETIDLPVVLFKLVDLKEAYSAPVSFTLISKDDTNADNNTKSATIEFTKQSGADLAVMADDVKNAVTVKNGKLQFGGDLHAGDTAALIYTAWNQGDLATAGLKVSVKLPKGVTFTEAEDDCEYDADKTSLVCTYANLPFVPQEQDTKDGDNVTAGGRFYHLLTVAEDVKAGALTGGTVSVEPIMPEKTITAQSIEIKTMPDNMTAVQATDLDTSDNTDGYAVVVAAQGGSGGGDDTGNDDGGLPVTGAKAGLIGGIGAAVLAAGGAMFLVARRRRVVLVTPGDEKPTA